MSKKKRKIRAEFRKGHDTRRRVGDLTRSYRQESEESHDDLAQAERVSGKGALTRKRTIVGQESVDDEASYSVQLDVDSDLCRPGRVIAVYGLSSVVHDENGACPPLRDARSAEISQHGPAACRGGGRSGLVPAGLPERGDH